MHMSTLAATNSWCKKDLLVKLVEDGTEDWTQGDIATAIFESVLLLPQFCLCFVKLRS